MMALFVPNRSLFTSLKNKVAVVSGGARGIGAATVTQFYNSGAHVVFGDISTAAGESFVSSLTSGSGSEQKGSVEFVPSDARSAKDVYRLFRKAFDTHGRVDHAVACAGILERGKWLDPDLTVDTLASNLEDEEANTVFDTNLVGTMHFTRAASVFLREGRGNAQGAADKSLTLMASTSSFRPSPGLYMYQISKHGVYGILRSTQSTLYSRDGIRVNALCPGMTESAMTASLVGKYKENGLFWQPAETCADVIAALASAGPNSEAAKEFGDKEGKGIVGKAFYVEGRKSWEFEESLWETMPIWLSEEGTKMLKTNFEAVRKVSLLKLSELLENES